LPDHAAEGHQADTPHRRSAGIEGDGFPAASLIGYSHPPLFLGFVLLDERGARRENRRHR